MTHHVAPAVTANEWRQLRDENGDVAVLFFKQSCPYCREFKPTWNKVAKRLALDEKTQHIPVVKVNVRSYPFVQREVGFRTVPTIVFYRRDQEPFNYTGSRQVDDVERAIRNHYGRRGRRPKKSRPKKSRRGAGHGRLRQRGRKPVGQAVQRFEERQPFTLSDLISLQLAKLDDEYR